MSKELDVELDIEIRDGLESRRGDWQKIADKAEVSHSWISQFVRKKIPNPGYETLKRLRTALAEFPAAEQHSERSTLRLPHREHHAPREKPSP